MARFAFTAAIPLVLAASSVMADTAPLQLTYEIFENSVSHLDLASCPEGLPQDNTFCRAAINHEEFHVFAFSYADDSPLVGYAPYSAEGIEALMD